MLGIIGGSGLTSLANLEVTGQRALQTPYGEPSADVQLGRIAGQRVAFLARHGSGHTIAPHEVNYRANLWALREAQVTDIVSIASVGGIRADLTPGALVVPHQILDYTWGRAATFFEGPGMPVPHVDFTEPYSAALRARLLAAAGRCGEAVADGCVWQRTVEATANGKKFQGLVRATDHQLRPFRALNMPAPQHKHLTDPTR